MLAAAAAGTRNAIRQLRSLLLEIYPPALRDQGLAAALPDAAAPLTARGVDVAVDVQAGLELPTDVERLVFRTAQEAIRNVGRHAAAGHVASTSPRPSGTVTLRVTDDGRGFDAEELARAAARGPHGPRHAPTTWPRPRAGALRVTSPESGGTLVELEVPVP